MLTAPLASIVLSLCLAPPASASAETSADAAPPKSGWVHAFVPRRRQWELGLFSGVMIVGDRHDFYDPATAPQVSLGRTAPMAGLRAAYFPLSFIGVEAEGWGAWTRVPDRADAPAFLYAMRGHAIAQLPLARVVPFVLGGYGLAGVRSPRDAVGNDVDPAGHYGIGVKLLVDGRFAVRLEGRHTMTAARARRRQVANHFSVLLGLSVRLGPEPSRGAGLPRPTQAIEADGDRDGDDVRDSSDVCPDAAGVTPHGCPQPDYDRDGLPDAVDACPAEPGAGAGCPAVDTDGDGRLDAEDRCPREASTEPDGCLPADYDGDGVADRNDACVTERGDASSGCPPQAVAPVVPAAQ